MRVSRSSIYHVLIVNIFLNKRYCDPCAAGKNPKTLTCSLCKNVGGAYKETELGGFWSHSLCTIWIPEAFLEQKGKKFVHNCSKVNQSRLNMKCSVCHETNGACVQCAFGKCCVAIHPWCALVDTNNSGCSSRIGAETGTLKCDIFCPKHAEMAKETPESIQRRETESASRQRSSTTTAQRRAAVRSMIDDEASESDVDESAASTRSPVKKTNARRAKTV